MNLLEELETHNYSKVPIYSGYRYSIIGFIKLKDLLLLKNSPSRSLKNSNLIHPIIKVNENLCLLDAIDLLKEKNINMAIVYNEMNTKATGMITLKKIF